MNAMSKKGKRSADSTEKQAQDTSHLLELGIIFLGSPPATKYEWLKAELFRILDLFEYRFQIGRLVIAATTPLADWVAEWTGEEFKFKGYTLVLPTPEIPDEYLRTFKWAESVEVRDEPIMYTITTSDQHLVIWGGNSGDLPVIETIKMMTKRLIKIDYSSKASTMIKY